MSPSQTDQETQDETCIDALARKTLRNHGLDYLFPQFLRAANDARDLMCDPIAIDCGITYVRGVDDFNAMDAVLKGYPEKELVMAEFKTRVNALLTQEVGIAAGAEVIKHDAAMSELLSHENRASQIDVAIARVLRNEGLGELVPQYRTMLVKFFSKPDSHAQQRGNVQGEAERLVLEQVLDGNEKKDSILETFDNLMLSLALKGAVPNTRIDTAEAEAALRNLGFGKA